MKPVKKLRRKRLWLVAAAVGVTCVVSLVMVHQNPRRRAIAYLLEHGHSVAAAEDNGDELIRKMSAIIGYKRTQKWFLFLFPVDSVGIVWSGSPDGTGMGQIELSAAIQRLKHFEELKQIDVYWDSSGRSGRNARVTDELRTACRVFGELPKLEKAYFQSAPFDDSCLTPLSRSEKLIHLMAKDAPVTGSMFESSWKSSETLWSIEVDDTKFHAKYVPALRQFQNLSTVSCYDCPDCDSENVQAERERRPDLSIDCN